MLFSPRNPGEFRALAAAAVRERSCVWLPGSGDLIRRESRSSSPCRWETGLRLLHAAPLSPPPSLPALFSLPSPRPAGSALREPPPAEAAAKPLPPPPPPPLRFPSERGFAALLLAACLSFPFVFFSPQALRVSFLMGTPFRVSWPPSLSPGWQELLQAAAFPFHSAVPRLAPLCLALPCPRAS